jgi:two-component system, OmpR family, sensor histidine kinase KdpD
LIKFTPADRNIKLSVELTKTKVLVGVQDSALVASNEEANKIFDRLSRAKSQHISGTGLGLYLCRRIVEAHGGVLDCIPMPGGGTSFSFFLPVKNGANHQN